MRPKKKRSLVFGDAVNDENRNSLLRRGLCACLCMFLLFDFFLFVLWLKCFIYLLNAWCENEFYFQERVWFLFTFLIADDCFCTFLSSLEVIFLEVIIMWYWFSLRMEICATHYSHPIFYANFLPWLMFSVNYSMHKWISCHSCMMPPDTKKYYLFHAASALVC